MVGSAAGTPDGELAARAGVDLSPVLEHPPPSPRFRKPSTSPTTTTRPERPCRRPGQPNRIRAIRTRDAKYAFYFDPTGRARTEYELYDLQRDPLETENLFGVRTGAPRSPAARTLHSELSDRLDEAMRECGTDQEGFVGSGTLLRT
jgi:arylsulfatase A-like enzyme